MNYIKKLPIWICSLAFLFACSETTYDAYTHIGEEMPFLESFKVTVNDVVERQSISVKKNKDSENMSVLENNGKHFVCVTVNVAANSSTEIESHTLDNDDFKLKDHPGFQIGGSYSNFSTIEAVNDFTWCGLEVGVGTDLTFEVCFMISEKINHSNTKMFLEVDFKNSINNSVDIYLKNREAE